MATFIFTCLSCYIQDKGDELHKRILSADYIEGDEYGKGKKALHIRTVASKSWIYSSQSDVDGQVSILKGQALHNL